MQDSAPDNTWGSVGLLYVGVNVLHCIPQRHQVCKFRHAVLIGSSPYSAYDDGQVFHHSMCDLATVPYQPAELALLAVHSTQRAFQTTPCPPHRSHQRKVKSQLHHSHISVCRASTSSLYSDQLPHRITHPRHPPASKHRAATDCHCTCPLALQPPGPGCSGPRYPS